MPTARAVITGALRHLGVLAAGEVATAPDAQDALDVLNEMLGAWNLEGLMATSTQRQEVLTSAGVSAYTVGVGGTWNLVRPVGLERVQLRPAGSTDEWPVDLLHSQEWAAIADKTRPGWPILLYYEAAMPLATALLWPVPDAAHTLILYARVPFSALADLDAALNFAPGYASALRHNLAARLAPEYGIEPSSTTVALAMSSKLLLQRRNVQVPLLRMPSGIPVHGQAFDITRGD